MIRPIFYGALALVIPISAYISLKLGGSYSFLAVLVSFGLLPLFEAVFPLARKNPKESDLLESSLFYDLLVYLMVPLQYFLVLTFCLNFKLAPWWEMLGMISALGMCCGVIGINVGHELGHRKKGFEQLFAKLLLATSLYHHFFVEHNKGHHRHVATPKDPSSARLNQNIFSFWWQSLTGSFLSALRLDKKEVLIWLGLQGLGVATIGFFFGPIVMIGFLGAALFGALLLESVNYIEHYGLQRNLNPSGRYEKVRPVHSWNSDHVLGRLILFNLTRHSDHHAFADRPYQALRTYRDIPHLPTGYPGMILLALIPPLFFRTMNPRVPRLLAATTSS